VACWMLVKASVLLLGMVTVWWSMLNPSSKGHMLVYKSWVSMGSLLIKAVKT
jgi:hypothetical protein